MKGGSIITVIFLLFLMIASIIGAIYVLDKVGVFNKEEVIYPRLSKIPHVGKFFAEKHVVFEEVEKEELRNLKESIDRKMAELKEKEERLLERERRLIEKEKEIAGLEKGLNVKKHAFEERLALYEDEERKWQKLALYYSNMSPDQAASILQNLDDSTVISIFRRMKDSAVSVCLMKMEPKRAAELSRKMAGL
ncbi:TPA: hypothetical protein DCX16_05285 [bacterium]|nr:hypothetical protein [bacterium]